MALVLARARHNVLGPLCTWTWLVLILSPATLGLLQDFLLIGIFHLHTIGSSIVFAGGHVVDPRVLSSYAVHPCPSAAPLSVLLGPLYLLSRSLVSHPCCVWHPPCIRSVTEFGNKTSWQKQSNPPCDTWRNRVTCMWHLKKHSNLHVTVEVSTKSHTLTQKLASVSCVCISVNRTLWKVYLTFNLGSKDILVMCYNLLKQFCHGFLNHPLSLCFGHQAS